MIRQAPISSGAGRLLLLLSTLLLAFPALGATVRLEVPTRTLEVGQQSHATIAVIDGRVHGVPTLEAEAGLEVEFVRQERIRRTVNWQSVHIVRFTYALRAQEEGTFRLGPATVRLGATGTDTMETESVPITVGPRSDAPEEPIVAHAEISPSSAWEGQVVALTHGIRSTVRIARSHWRLPSAPTLVRPRDGDPVRRQYQLDDPEGPIWVEETTAPYLVTGSDNVELEPAVAFVDVHRDPAPRERGFFGLAPVEQRNLLTDPVRLEVRPLPPAPPGFRGLVGDFTVQGRLEGPDLAVGQSTEWTLQIVGDGTLEGFTLPLPSQLSGARLYDGTPSVAAQLRDDGYHAVGTYRVVVVPTQPGTLEVPPVEIVTFSPSEGRYVTHRVELSPLEVAPGAEGDEDLRSFATEGPRAERTSTPTPEIHPPYARGAAHTPFLGPVLGYGVLLGGILLGGLLGADAWQAW